MWPRRSEVALFVEDIVEGQQALVLFEEQAATIEQNGGVDGRLSTLALCQQSHARQHGGRQLAGGRGKFIDGGAAAGQKAGLFQKVGRGVTAKGQLGKDGKPRALSGGAAADSDNFF